MIPVLSALLSAASVWACRICDSPPAPRPANDDPKAPYDLRAPRALSEEELPFLLGLEEGRRYRQQGPFIVDLEAHGDGHLLTGTRIGELLREHSRRTATALELRYSAAIRSETPVILTDADRGAARHLADNRYPLLEPAQRDFLQKLLGGRAMEMPSMCVAGFGCKVEAPAARMPAGAGPAGAPRGPPPAAALPAPDPLYDSLLRRVKFDSRGRDAEKKLYEATVRRMLESPTARDLAQKLINEGGKFRVSFETFDNTVILEDDGKKHFSGTGGRMRREGDTLAIELNSAYLDMDPNWTKDRVTVSLSHELLGHALQDVRADQLGVKEAYHYYRDNETNAGLVGWVVEAELSGWTTSGHAWNYLRDPESYHKTLQVMRPYYAASLSPAEMSDPAGTLEARLKNAQDAGERLAARRKRYELWREVLEHFVTKHARSRSDFTDAAKEISSQLGGLIPAAEKDITAITDYLPSMIKWFKSASGKREREQMTSPKAKEFFAEREAEVAAQRKKLEGLLAKKGVTFPLPPAAATASEPGHIAALAKLYEDDVKLNPGHWPEAGK